MVSMSFLENSTGSDGFSPSSILDCSYSKIEIFYTSLIDALSLLILANFLISLC